MLMMMVCVLLPLSEFSVENPRRSVRRLLFDIALQHFEVFSKLCAYFYYHEVLVEWSPKALNG